MAALLERGRPCICGGCTSCLTAQGFIYGDPDYQDEDEVAASLADEAEANILAGAQRTTGWDGKREAQVALADELSQAFDDALAALLLVALRKDAAPATLDTLRRAIADAIGRQNAGGVWEAQNPQECDTDERMEHAA